MDGLPLGYTHAFMFRYLLDDARRLSKEIFFALLARICACQTEGCTGLFPALMPAAAQVVVVAEALPVGSGGVLCTLGLLNAAAAVTKPRLQVKSIGKGGS